MSESATTRILHFAQDDDTSGFFPQLAKWHDRDRYLMYFGTLKPMAPWLRDYMLSNGVQCLSCGCESRYEYPAGMLKLAAFLHRERIDILHTHLFEPSVIGLFAGVLARTDRRVMTRHYSDYHTRIHKTWHVRLDQLCTRMCDAVIAVSEHTATHMIGEESAPAHKVRVVMNGIDFERVKVSRSNAGAIRREFAAEDAYLLTIIARLHPEKGHSYLFRALPEIHRRIDRKLLLLVAGTGPFEAAYKREVESVGCSDMVRFLGYRHDAADLIAASDLLVLPSVAEAFGLVLAEALYIGTPVVATRVGGIPEIIDDGSDGLLVPAQDSGAIAQAIASLLNNSQLRIKMAGAGKDKVVGRFEFGQMMRSYEALYEQVTANA